MKITTNKIVSATLIAAVLFLNSCKKEETLVSTESSDITANTQLESNSAMFKLQREIPKLIAKQKGSFKSDQLIGDFDCATVVIDSVSVPHLAYIGFGSTGCFGSDGVHYGGNITIQFNSEDMSQPGSTWTATFRNFRQDTILLNGSMGVTNTGLNHSGNLTATINFNLTTNSVSEGLIMNGNSIFYLEAFARDTTTDSDDQLYYTGGGAAVTRGGNSLSQTITSPLLINTCSPHFVSGTVLQRASGIRDRVIDYGTGFCDNKATVTSGSTTRTIILY